VNGRRLFDRALVVAMLTVAGCATAPHIEERFDPTRPVAIRSHRLPWSAGPRYTQDGKPVDGTALACALHAAPESRASFDASARSGSRSTASLLLAALGMVTGFGMKTGTAQSITWGASAGLLVWSFVEGGRSERDLEAAVHAYNNARLAAPAAFAVPPCTACSLAPPTARAAHVVGLAAGAF